MRILMVRFELEFVLIRWTVQCTIFLKWNKNFFVYGFGSKENVLWTLLASFKY